MNEQKKRLFGNDIRQSGMIFALVFIILFFGIVTQGVMFRPMNVSNVFMQNSYVIFLAIGMFFLHFDRKCGSVCGISSSGFWSFDGIYDH